MAIDDNTSYALTGAQVKDLASKINAKADTTDLPSVMTGATAQVDGASGLVPAPTTSDVDKYLKGDGTWGTISAPTVTLYSGTGQNTDGAMTQKATTNMIFNNANNSRIQIGGFAGAETNLTVAIGYFASVPGNTSGGVAIGYDAATGGDYSVALGYESRADRAYELSIGASATGTNPETTRYIAHVTAGVNDTDAVNKKQLDDAIAAAVGNIETILQTLNSGNGAQ